MVWLKLFSLLIVIYFTRSMVFTTNSLGKNLKTWTPPLPPKGLIKPCLPSKYDYF
jgi:hypothetical protein